LYLYGVDFDMFMGDAVDNQIWVEDNVAVDTAFDGDVRVFDN